MATLLLLKDEDARAEVMEKAIVLRKSNLLILLFIVAVIVSGCSRQADGEQKEPVDLKAEDAIENSNLIMAQSYLMGSFAAAYLYEDMTYIYINQYNTNGIQCQEGKVSSDEYASLTEFIETSKFFETKITQEEDPSLVCDGGESVKASLNWKSNLLSSLCTVEPSESTEQAEALMEGIAKRLYEAINTSRQPCQTGGYIITYGLGSCKDWVERELEWNYEEPEYEKKDLGSLDPDLKKSLMYEDAYIFIGPINEMVESFNRKYYSIGDYCYFVMLSEFDGTRFDYYR